MTQIQEITSKLNIIRNKFLRLDFTAESLEAALRAESVLYPKVYLGKLVRSKNVEKVSRGTYRFFERPIHIDTVTQIYKDAAAAVAKYGKTHREKVQIQKDSSTEESRIAQAITLLKQSGRYRILEKVTDYREI